VKCEFFDSEDFESEVLKSKIFESEVFESGVFESGVFASACSFVCADVCPVTAVVSWLLPHPERGSSITRQSIIDTTFFIHITS
jgi:hypothetical protein